jgi:prepilin-type N-terminal cleavage/methylation domain-containing protein
MRDNEFKQGFTLIEIVVSVTLLVILTSAFMTIISATTGTEQRAIEFNDLTSLYSRKIDGSSVEITSIEEVTEGTTIEVILTPTTVAGSGSTPETLELNQYKVSTGDGRTLKKVRGSKYNAGSVYYYK